MGSNKEKDIAHFDWLEKNLDDPSKQMDGLSEQEKEVLNSVSALDDMMLRQPVEHVSDGFRERLMTSVAAVKTSKSRIRMFSWLFVLFFLLIGLSWLFASVQENIATPTYVDQFADRFSSLLGMIADPRFKQIFLISEGIICLVILEKIVSSLRFFKFPAGG